MSNINKSNTPKSEKDCWRTPPELVNYDGAIEIRLVPETELTGICNDKTKLAEE